MPHSVGASSTCDNRGSRTAVLLQALLQDESLNRERNESEAARADRRLDSTTSRLGPLPVQLPVGSRCSSSSSCARSSRSQAKDSLQVASSTILASPSINRKAKASFHRSTDLAFEKNARGYDKGRTPTPPDVTSIAHKHLDEDLQDLCSSPLSAKSTATSLFGGDTSDDTPGGPHPLSRSQPIPARSSMREAHADSRGNLAAPLATLRSRLRPHVRTPVEEGEESAEEFGKGDLKHQRQLSKLLSRRQSVPLHVCMDIRPARLEGASPLPKHGRRHSMSYCAEVAPSKTIRHLRPDEKIFDLYQWSEVLQEEGDGGKVVVCKPKVPARHRSESYVMKIRSKENLEETHFREQYRKSVLRMLNLPAHAGVLPFHEVLEDEKYIYVVMEKANGGNFFSSLLSEFQDGVMPGSAMRNVMREILEAVSHIHKQGILHRDIKPDNLVMQWNEADDGRSKVKKVALIDFDHADPDWDPFSPSVRQNEFCGTVQFSAPEAFVGYFSQSSDLYSIGVILYLLMTGKMPYSEEIYLDEIKRRGAMPKCVWGNKTMERMQATDIDWLCNPWPEQGLCKSFCMQLLAFDPLKRPASADEALQHPWFTASSE